MQMAAIAPAVQPAVQMMSVTVPDGVPPGGLFNIQIPSGQMMSVTCPPGATAGQQIQVAVAAQAADTSFAVAKLGSEGFVLGKIISHMAPGDGQTMLGGMVACHGMMAQQKVSDLSGAEIATVEYLSTNLEYGHQSARIVATDGTVLAAFDKPKRVATGGLLNMGGGAMDHYAAPYTIVVNGVPYADVVAFVTSMNAGGMAHTMLTRKDGSGGLKMGKRVSRQGYYMCMAFALWVPTLTLGSWFFFYLMWTCPALIHLTGLDGVAHFPPILGLRGKETVAFSPTTIPIALAKHAKKYVEANSPGTLEGSARLDALLLLVITYSMKTLCNSD